MLVSLMSTAPLGSLAVANRICPLASCRSSSPHRGMRALHGSGDISAYVQHIPCFPLPFRVKKTSWYTENARTSKMESPFRRLGRGSCPKTLLPLYARDAVKPSSRPLPSTRVQSRESLMQKGKGRMSETSVDSPNIRAFQVLAGASWFET
ncbi:uncharacterized protein P884DRAFT_258592 [Thermothelomyces heterothallicus CBS 202.75]|uniref:uncharacterized protein n=1 Tax=Thermothelomyces heterothallicus CBS 202.75 TaxID=1149848 RepID=UPI0037432E76